MADCLECTGEGFRRYESEAFPGSATTRRCVACAGTGREPEEPMTSPPRSREELEVWEAEHEPVTGDPLAPDRDIERPDYEWWLYRQMERR